MKLLALQNFVKNAQRMLPTWRASDVGHTASRDWYAALVVAGILSASLVGISVVRFIDVAEHTSTVKLPPTVRGLPITEASIFETVSQFESRAQEYGAYTRSAPKTYRPRTAEVEVPTEVPPDTE